MNQIVKNKSSENKYLSFLLGDERYGIPILFVSELIQMMDITPVPHVPDFIRGVINLRGRVIPVLELRLKFGMEKLEDTKSTCVIVVQIENEIGKLTMGIIVDAVNDVQQILEEDVDPAPSFGTAVDTSFILGVGKINKQVTMLLDMNKVLTDDEIKSVEQTGSQDA